MQKRILRQITCIGINTIDTLKIKIVIRSLAPKLDVVSPRTAPTNQQIIFFAIRNGFGNIIHINFCSLGFIKRHIHVLLNIIKNFAFVRRQDTLASIPLAMHAIVFANRFQIFPKLHARVLDISTDIMRFSKFLQNDAIELSHARKAKNKERGAIQHFVIKRFSAILFAFESLIIKIRNRQVLNTSTFLIKSLANIFVFEHFVQQRIFTMEYRRIKFLLPHFTASHIFIRLCKEQFQVTVFPLFENAKSITLCILDKPLRAARFVIQEQRSHFVRKVKETIFIKDFLKIAFFVNTINHQITSHLVIKSLVIRNAIFFFSQVSENNVRQHFRSKLRLGFIFTHQNIKQETVNRTLVQICKNAIFLYPAQTEPLFQLGIRKNHHGGLKRILPIVRDFFNHLIGEMFQIQCKIQVKHTTLFSLKNSIKFLFL